MEKGMTNRRGRTHTISAQVREWAVDELKRALALHPEVAFAYLHGSFVSEPVFRDLDVAVYLDPEVPDRKPPWQYESELGSELEAALRMPVDVRVLNCAALSFRYQAVKGHLLAAREADLVDEFRARTWDDYFDFAPFARRYLREVLSE